MTTLLSTTHRYRIRFSKEGNLRFLSHHDLMRLWERMLRRAALPVAASQGFNPRPRIIFAQALGLGIASRDEAVDLELTKPIPPDALRQQLRAQAPPGMQILDLQPLASHKAPRPLSAHYSLQIPPDRLPAAHAAAQRFLDASAWPYHRIRDQRTLTLDLRPLVSSLHIDPLGTLHFSLTLGEERSARPEEILDALALRDGLVNGLTLVRTRLILAPEPPADSPSPTQTPSLSHTDSGPVTPAPLACAKPDGSLNSWPSQIREIADPISKEHA